MSWIGVLTVVLMVASVGFGYVKYKEYAKDVQRDLYSNLVGRTYPHFGERYDDEHYPLQVININTKRSGLREWKTTVFLKFDMEEFPWEDADIGEWNYEIPIGSSAADRDDIEDIEQVMEEELLFLCSIDRKIGPKFQPQFFDSAYGPALLLIFETRDLHLITEQLEMVAENVPLVFTTWYQSLMGLSHSTLYPAMIKMAAQNPDIFRSPDIEVNEE
jgi:hypothetical protein